MRRYKRFLDWPYIAGFALLQTGCDSSDRVASPPRTDQSTDLNASAEGGKSPGAHSTDAASSGNLVARESRVASQAAPHSSAAQTTPASLEESTRIIDLRKFAMLPAAKVFHKQPAKVGYELLTADTTQAAQFYRSKLAEAGWQLEPEVVHEQNSLRMFSGTKQGFSVSVTCVNDPTSGKAQAFVENQGNVDARTLPRLPGAKLNRAYFHTINYRATAKLEDAVEFARTALKKQGWREVVYGPKDPVKQSGRKDRMGFLQRGYEINATFDVEESQIEINCFVHLVQDELPIMPEALGAIEFIDNPTRLFYGVPTTPDQVLTYHRQELPKLGWTIRAGTDKIEDGTAKITLDAAEKPSLRLELLEDQPGHTAILITRANQPEDGRNEPQR